MKKALIIAGAVLMISVLAWTTLVGASPAAPADGAWPPTPPAGIERPWRVGFEPGLYLLHDYFNADAYRYGLTGGLVYFNWSDVEDQVQGQYDWTMIDNWIAQEAAAGKKAAIAITTYNGRSAQRNGFPNGLPTYIQNNPQAAHKDIDGWALPLYWHDAYLNPYHDFVQALGERYRDDPRVAWIAIGIGRYGEITAYDNTDEHPDHTFMVNTYGFDVDKWVTAADKIIDYYVDAFSEDGKLKKELFAQTASWTFTTRDRRDIAEYAAEHGVGLSLNGLYPDQELATTGPADPAHSYIGLYDQIYRTWSGNLHVPVAFESYDYMLCNPTQVYWGLINGLDKHTDVFRLSIDLIKDPEGNDRPENIALIKWAKNYLGATITNTPSIWVAMRDHRIPWLTCKYISTGQRPDSPYASQKGNYSFWLYQDDNITGGKTVPETYEEYADPAEEGGAEQYPIEKIGDNIHPYNPNLPHVKEAWVIRRTDQASGNPYMWFKVDDRYIFGGSHRVTVTVTYLDMYTDTWDLSYDSVDGEKIATPLGSSVNYVQKEGTKEVRKAVFVLPDARFANGLTGGADFRISCRNDGDEWIHMVDVTDGRWTPPAEPTPTPTATPTVTPTPIATPTPSTGAVHGMVWQDSNQDGTPQPGESGIPGVKVEVRNLQGTPVAEATTDTGGLYAMSGIEPSTIPYKVVETDPAGCTSTTPNEVLKVFQAGIDWQVDFGDYCVPTPTPTLALGNSVYLPILLK